MSDLKLKIRGSEDQARSGGSEDHMFFGPNTAVANKRPLVIVAADPPLAPASRHDSEAAIPGRGCG